jgi:HlyD family secretion protein
MGAGPEIIAYLVILISPLSPIMSQLAVPNVAPEPQAKIRVKGVYLAAPLVVATLAAGGYWLATRTTAVAPGAMGSPTFVVSLTDMEIKIAKDGELQAANNIEIQCRVEGQTAIQTLVKEGVTVKKGDVLATLDASAISQKIEDTTLELQTAEAALTSAREMVEIQKLANAANLEAASVALLLAKLDHQQYTEGTYPALVKAAHTTTEMADITLKNTLEDLEQTRALATKGFVTAADVKKSELAVTTARQALDKAQTDEHVLTRYTHEADLAAKKNALAQAEQRLVRTRRENASNLSQKEADAQAKAAALSTLKRRMERLQIQLAACTIAAPADGIVVYATSADRNAQSALQEGTAVRERQPLFRLPDTSEMNAVIRVQESQVAKLRIGQRGTARLAGVPEPIGVTVAKISVLADSSNRFWNPDLREYPVELTLDRTPPDLKPGMKVDAEVFIERLEDVRAVPAAAVYAAGPDHYVFVRGDGEQVRPVKVALGQSNETQVAIDGPVPDDAHVILLQAGQGRTLLEAAGIKVATPTQPAEGRRRRNKPEGETTPAVPTHAAPVVTTPPAQAG